MSRTGCMNMNLKTITQAKETVIDHRTQFCKKGQILRNSCEAPKMRVFQKNQNGAHDGAQGGFLQRNTLSQEPLKQRIYAVCAGRSDGT